MNPTPRRRGNPRRRNTGYEAHLTPAPQGEAQPYAVSELLSLLNMAQTQLARLCGISPGYFSLLMAGQRSPSPFTRQRLQEILGVSDFDRLFIMEPAGDGLYNTAFADLWLADDSEISGATGSTYTLADTDEGKAIKVQVTFTGIATAAVAAAPEPLTVQLKVAAPTSHDG